MCGGDQDDLEGALVEHSVEAAGAFAQGECCGFVIPTDWDLGEGTLFVVESGSLVLVEKEAAAGSGVDEEGGGVGGLFADVLHGRRVRNDRSGADVDGDTIERGGGVDAAAGGGMAGPVVVP